MSRSLRRLVSLLGIGIVLGLPGAIAAHEGGSFIATAAGSPPTIDGVVGGTEWASATPYDVAFGPFGTGTVRFLHANGDLYVGVVIKDPEPSTGPSFGVFFDDDHDGEISFQDDVWRASNGRESGQDLHVDDSGSSHNEDAVNDTEGAGTVDGDVMFELKHSLCTDRSQDMCASVGQTLGLTFQYRHNADLFFNAPPANSDLFDPSDWAHLTLASSEDDTTPPEVTVIAPKPGDVVSGTITAVAEASDNVGVASVEFLYFDGEGDGPGTDYSLGVDETAPYEAVFDSTQVPNTLSMDATMYAIARDAAGNQTQAGNGITVFNANVTGASITITGDPSSQAGAASAPIEDIPVDAIRGAEDDGPDSAPLAGIPLAGIPLAGIPLAGIPLAGIPLAGIGFTTANLNQNGLGGIPLSSIPLASSSDSWRARLNASTAFSGTPEQSVTLAQVIGTPVVTTPTPVTLDDVDLEGSPLAGIPLAGIALGGLPLAGIPLAGIGSTPAENLAAWCAFINTQPGFSCTDPNSLTGQTMIGIALQGVPLAGIPLAGIPLAGIDLTGSPLAGIPLAGIDLEGSPLAGIPLAGIDFASSPLAGIPLAGISPAARDEILTCSAGDPACADSSTLGQAHAAGAVDPSATVGDIGYYCTPGSPANADCLVGHTPILLEDFVLNGLPADVTLEDLLASLLADAAYDWEALPLPGFPIQDFSDDGGINDYDVEFTLSGDEGRTAPAAVRVQIPDGARYVLGSSNLPSEERSLPDPTLNKGNELEWRLTDIPLNRDVTLHFRVRPGLELRTENATAEVFAGSRSGPIHAETEVPASTRIFQTFGCSIECEGTPEVEKDTLYLGYTANGDDRDFFRLAVPEPGTQVTVRLSHLGVDDDLVVFGEVPPPLRQPKASTSTLQAGDVGTRPAAAQPGCHPRGARRRAGDSAGGPGRSRHLRQPRPRRRGSHVRRPRGRGRMGEHPDHELRRRVLEQAVDAPRRGEPADRAAARLQDAVGTRWRHDEGAARVRRRQHALPLQLEAVRRPLRERERDRGVEQAADAGSPLRRGRRHGHPDRCDPGHGRDSRRLAGQPVLRGPEQRRRPGGWYLPRRDHGGLQVHRDRR